MKIKIVCAAVVALFLATCALAQGEKVVRKAGGVLMESAVNRPMPTYPPGASGSAVVEVTAAADGTVESARFVAGNPDLESASLEAARLWTFRRSTLGGEPVKVIGTITFAAVPVEGLRWRDLRAAPDKNTAVVQPKIDVYIPAGMPVSLSVRFDPKAENRWLIERTVGPEVDKVKVVIILHSEATRSGRGMITQTSRQEPTASIAWPEDKPVERLIIIAQRVDTDDGSWLIDAPSEVAALERAVDTGAVASLRAKFYKSVTIEKHIPAGMEGLISFNVSRDLRETDIHKYRCIRKAAPEVTSLTMVVIMVGPDNKVLGARGEPFRYTTGQIEDPSEVAWSPSEDVRKLIFVVERLETKGGAWVLDSEFQGVKIRDIVEHGAYALPRAKFVPF